jgi:hypothetical protein
MMEQRRYTAEELNSLISSEFIALVDELVCRRGEADYRVRSEEVELCNPWIQRHYQHRNKINTKANSALGGRDCVQEATGQYIGEASFIVAALDLGFTGKVVGRSCYFNFALRDPHANGNG